MSLFEKITFYTHNFAQDQPYIAYNHAVLQKADRKQPNAPPVVLGNRDDASPNYKATCSSRAPAGGTSCSLQCHTVPNLEAKPNACSRSCQAHLASMPSQCYKS